MQFKSDRQRRRHHTTRKTLQRYKRQLNGEDRKSWYATPHQHYRDQEHYELAFFDERGWHQAMRAAGTLGKFAGTTTASMTTRGASSGCRPSAAPGANAPPWPTR